MSVGTANLEIMKKFDEETLPSLSTAVMAALELFVQEGRPRVAIPDYKKPIVVGSGNAIVTAQMLYGGSDAIFADENNFKEALSREHDGVVIFSASGEKHATVVAEYYSQQGEEVTLVTCSASSSAGKILGEDHVVVTPKNREPYTYNTSTYMGWLFAKTGENPEEVWRFIKEKVAVAVDKKIGAYDGYLLITPEWFSRGKQLFEVKFVELFGRRVARDVRTFEELKHAVTVIPFEKEVCVQFGEGEVEFANTKLKVPMPEKAGLATIMAIGYWVIGQIQENKPQWFKDNIGEYIARAAAKPFGKGLKVVVD